MNREQDLRDSLASNEFAFVARLSHYQRISPGAGGKHFRGSMDFDVLENIKGVPEADLQLVEWTSEPALPGVPPGPACGPFVAIPQNEGAVFLIFASRVSEAGYLHPDALSYRLDLLGADPEKWVDLVRTIHHDSLTP